MIKNLSNMKNYNAKRERCCEYIEALEEERRKINVFYRELPLCLKLVTQAIEAYKKEISETTTKNLYKRSECLEGTTGECRPVLDLFIPIKHSPTSTEEEDEVDDDDEHKSHETLTCFDDKNMKSEWLKSVQLWNQPEAVLSNNNSECSKEETETVVEIIKGAASRYETSNGKNYNVKSPATSSGGGGQKKEADKAGIHSGKGRRKEKRIWSQELQKRFLNALKQLGGPHATPKQIKELMKVDGLTSDQIKSHLQKYRMHTRRSSQTNPNNINFETPHLVVVGEIWVPQANYSTANAATLGETPTGIYWSMRSPNRSNFCHTVLEERSKCSNKGIFRCNSSAMSSSTPTKTKYANIL
ncbi:myb family transcription factor [Arabis alpina]|uniref:Myb family transcription factor n=1 Tax=Arabis alpina TaxID=50452 RepID=A0A087GYX7_ARAAL|nr:myb family transcription factor [Arabis alpina]